MVYTKKFLLALVTTAALAGSAFAANDSTFGPVQSTAVAAGGSYAGITLTATDGNNGDGGFDFYNEAVTLPDIDGNDVTFNIHTEQPSGFGPGGAEGFGSTLTFLAGTASSATTVNVSVRKPNDNEVFGYSTIPPMDNSPGYISLLSDVFEVSGVAGPGTQLNGKTQTDVFALQISYLDNNPANTNTTPEAFMEDYVYEYGNTADWTEADIAADGELQLAFFDTTTGQYTEDDTGTINPGSTVIENYFGSWSAFVAAFGVTEANLADFNGSWGVDTANNDVWLITDHNTTFAVVPEPQSLAVLAIGTLLLARRRRRCF